MARPPVDTRLQNIERSQNKIEKMLEKALEQEINPNDSTKKDVISAEKVDCECNNITAEQESEQKKVEKSGESKSE